MSHVRFGIGGKRKPKVLGVGLARKPFLLFCHGRGIRPKKGHCIEATVKYEIIQFSELRLVDYLSCSVEILQGKEAVHKVYIGDGNIWIEAQTLAECFRRLLIMSLKGVNNAYQDIRSVVSRIACDLLLIYLRGLVYFPSYIRVVRGGYVLLFALVGMLAQLECFGEVLTGSPQLLKAKVICPHCPIAHGKVRVQLDRTLVKRQRGCFPFFAKGLHTEAVRFQCFERGCRSLGQRDIKSLHCGE